MNLSSKKTKSQNFDVLNLLPRQKYNDQIAVLLIKGLIILAPAGGVLADFWVPNEIDSLNFQHKS